jgi:hypothetical protein
VPLRRTDTIALALWIASVARVVIAAVAGPDGQCDYDNHDTYVVEAHRAGYVLLAAAVTMTGAAAFLVASAFGGRAGRSRVLHVIGGAASLAIAGGLGLIALLQLIAFSCLE